MWFDSHCHLHLVEEEEELDPVLDRAAGAGVTGILAVGIDVASSRRALEIAKERSLWSSAGVHPNSADRWTPEAAGAIEELLGEDRVVAVGETGLDNYWDMVRPEVQMDAFLAHIELAKRFDKALVIHTRRSTTQALDALEEVGPPPRFVFHCWQGKPGEMDRALEMGAFVSFAGNAWSKKSVRKAPRNRYLVETDSPYLTPDAHKGRRNRPEFVVAVGRSVAEVRGEDAEVVAADTTANARRLFGLGQ